MTPPRGPAVSLMLATAANTDTGEVDPARVVDAARVAETAGFDAIYVGDHLLHPNPLLESVVTLSVVAASTDRIALGPCVMLLALRHPVAIAKQLGTLAAFAPGRLRVGVGVGGDYPAEFEAAGVPPAERGPRLETALQRVRSLLTDGIARDDVTIAPTAPDVPFLFGGRKEPSLRRAATHGDGWIGYLVTPEGFARRRTLLLDHRAEHGRAGDLFTTAMLVPVHADRSPGTRLNAAAAWSTLTGSQAGFPEHLFVAGSPAEIVEQLHEYWVLGCTELVLAPADQGNGYFDQVRILAHEVLPELKSFT